jgi:hypothetical protein
MPSDADPGQRSVERAGRLARWLDQGLVDPLVGLVLPGGGDLLSAGLGLYLVVVALRLQLPRIVVARMLLNLAIDALLGSVPVLGDVFDFAFRANLRNLRLLEARHEARRPAPGDWLVVAGALLLFLLAISAPVLLLGWALAALARG